MKIKTEKMVYNHIVKLVEDNIIMEIEEKQENVFLENRDKIEN